MRSELWKILHHKSFKISFLTAATICSVDALFSIEVIIGGLQHNTEILMSNGMIWPLRLGSGYSIFYFWIGVENGNITQWLFKLLFPLLAGLPAGLLYIDERKNGYEKQCLIRQSPWQYYGKKLFAGMIAGGMVVAGSAAINFVINLGILPLFTPEVQNMTTPLSENQFASRLFFHHPFIFTGVDLLVMVLWGAALAAAALAAVTLIRNRYFGVLTPFLCCLLIEIICEMPAVRTEVEWSPQYLFHLATRRASSGWIIFGEMFGVMIISALLFMKTNTKREIYL